jgi:hypothetical protein
MSFVYVHMSLSSKLVPDCVLFVTATFNLSSQRLYSEANTLPARGATGHDALAPPRFSKFSQKKLQQLCRD